MTPHSPGRISDRVIALRNNHKMRVKVGNAPQRGLPPQDTFRIFALQAYVERLHISRRARGLQQRQQSPMALGSDAV